MKKESEPHTSQDHDRKFQHDHIKSNPRAAKDLPGPEDDASEEGSETTDTSQKTADLIAKGHTISNNPSLKPAFTEDKRESARHEHTNHFTNRASEGKK